MTKRAPSKPKKRNSFARILLRFTIVAVLVFTLTVVIGTHKAAWLRASRVSHVPILSNLLVIASRPDRETYLLIGTDARPGDEAGNSDVLSVASIDHLHHRIEFLSIPRDTWVPFPDGHEHKINQALHDGGPDLAMTLIENLIGVPINHYVTTRFDGLVRVVDDLGGIPIHVEKNMYYRTGDKVHGLIALHQGNQVLSGEKALGYVRYRHDALGDIGRTERQQKFLEALIQTCFQPSVVPKLPLVIRDAWKSVDTNADFSSVAELAKEVPSMKTYTLVHATLPGSFHDPISRRDSSYWVVNPSQAHYVARQFFEDGVVPKPIIQEPSITAHWIPPKKTTTQFDVRQSPV